MTNLNYKEIREKDCKDIVGLVESARPELSTKPCAHYVFKVETVDFKDKSSVEVSWIHKWWGWNKVKLEGGKTGVVERDVLYLMLAIGTEVTAKEVVAELLKILNSAASSMEELHDHSCFTIELLNSHIDMTDFTNAYADDIDHVDQKLCTGNIFWIDDAKIMTFYC